MRVEGPARGQRTEIRGQPGTRRECLSSPDRKRPPASRSDRPRRGRGPLGSGHELRPRHHSAGKASRHVQRQWALIKASIFVVTACIGDPCVFLENTTAQPDGGLRCWRTARSCARSLRVEGVAQRSVCARPMYCMCRILSSQPPHHFSVSGFTVFLLSCRL